MRSTDFLGKTITITIDRPLGSKHPRHNFLYPINYGYVPNTVSGDGHPIDAYVLGVGQPIQEFTGVCIAIIKRKEEDDDKLVLVPKGVSFTKEEIEKRVHFQEQWYTIEIIF